AVHDLTGAPRGTLRVTAPVALGRQHISPSLGSFLLRYPDVRLELELTDRIVNLAHEGFDLAIRHTRHIPDNFVVWELARSRSALVGTDAYLARKGLPRHPTDLTHHDCVLYTGSPRSIAFQKEGSDLTVYADVQPRFTANNSEVLREVVLSGAALGLLPDFSLKGGQESPLQQVLPEWSVQGYFGVHILAVRPFSPQIGRASCRERVQVLAHSDHLR